MADFTPKDALDFLKLKKIVPSENWDDLKHGEHSHAFTVAHSLTADILNDIFEAMNNALEKGQSFKDFKKNIKPILKEKGWYGGRDNISKEQKNSYLNWRLKIIYKTNMTTSYQSGRYRKMQRLTNVRPYWVYSAVMDQRTRKEHMLLNNKCFRYDDPFWDSHYPPNGWGCRCTVYSVTENTANRDYDVTTSNDDGSIDSLNVNWDLFCPEEWRYNPGKEKWSPDWQQYTYLKNYIISKEEEKKKTALDLVKESYREQISQYQMNEAEWKNWVNEVTKANYKPQGFDRLLTVLNKEIEDKTKTDPRLYVTDSKLRHSIRDSKRVDKPERILSIEECRQIWKWIKDPDYILKEKKPKRNYDTYHYIKVLDDENVIRLIFKKKFNNCLEFYTSEKVSKIDGLNKGNYDEIYKK
ncbi:MAG TPA: phage minor head protein [Spirochaetota bacterium]|nr:phage minor head protein [Spirochaetota bacterium]